MSTITITNIKATGDSVSRSAKSIAAVWVNFNGTGTIAIRDSINVTSLTDHGTANHDVNFTNHMATIGYHVSNSSSGNVSDVWGFANPGNETSNVQVVLKYVSANAAGTYTADRSAMTTGVHGDLA
tara:strand:- start:176 stop:553 length:378 start_codon:yes stop_codon:yes gene_type:complete